MSSPGPPPLSRHTPPCPRTATRCSLSCSLFLTPARAGATAARERATPPGGSTPDPSAPRPSLGSAAATSWLRPSRWSAGAVATARVGWHGASRNYQTPPDLVVKFQPLDIVGFIL